MAEVVIIVICFVHKEISVVNTATLAKMDRHQHCGLHSTYRPLLSCVYLHVQPKFLTVITTFCHTKWLWGNCPYETTSDLTNQHFSWFLPKYGYRIQFLPQ